MSTIERTDCHAPSKLIPTNYEYVGQDYGKIEGMGDAAFMLDERARIRAHMDRTGGTYSRHQHGGNCMVCGSVNAVYTVLFYHAPTNTYVRTGQECAALIDAQAAAGLDRLRTAVRDWREAQKGVKKAKALLADAGLTAAWDIYAASGVAPREEMTIRDIVGKLVRYGSISDKQTDFLRKLMAAIAERPQREAARAAEQAAAADCPAGRLTIKGEILSVRVEASAFGYGRHNTVTKMLVRAESGFKVWGTMPAGTNANKGDKITFKATVKPSDTDAKFGFASRPSLVEVQQVAAAQ